MLMLDVTADVDVTSD